MLKLLARGIQRITRGRADGRRFGSHIAPLGHQVLVLQVVADHIADGRSSNQGLSLFVALDGLIHGRAYALIDHDALQRTIIGAQGQDPQCSTGHQHY